MEENRDYIGEILDILEGTEAFQAIGIVELTKKVLLDYVTDGGELDDVDKGYTN